MTYKLAFREEALREWHKLGDNVRIEFKKKLTERLVQPRVESDRLSGVKDRYKIKLRQAGYRLVYEVSDNTITLIVVAVGTRERHQVYKIAAKRI